MIGRLIRWIVGGFLLALTTALAGAAIAMRRITSVGTETDDEVALAAIFGPLAFESHAASFRGGTVLLWFGGGDLDLRGATLDPGGGHLAVRMIFGGGRIIVPESWDVDLRVRAIFGGAADVRPAFERAPDAPRLIVDGFALFGGFAVFSSKPEMGAPTVEDASVRG
jgi:predicted membrane protein